MGYVCPISGEKNTKIEKENGKANVLKCSQLCTMLAALRKFESTSKQKVITKGEANKRFQLSANSLTLPTLSTGRLTSSGAAQSAGPTEGEVHVTPSLTSGLVAIPLLVANETLDSTLPSVKAPALPRNRGTPQAKSWSPWRPFLYQKDGVPGSRPAYPTCKNYFDREVQEGNV